MATDFLFDGPEDARVTIMLAHGAGAPMDSASMNATTKALAAAGFQATWISRPAEQLSGYLTLWIGAAVVSAVAAGAEMGWRWRTAASPWAREKTWLAVEQFLPAGVAGVLLAILLWKFAPETLWMLPGLWQVLISLGVFASVRSLPRTIALAGAWYFLSGFTVVVIASQSHTLSPWTMGLPFAVGQLLMAALLYFASGENDVED